MSRRVRRSIDPNRVREAYRGHGSDTRVWLAFATVATVKGETPDFTDGDAVLVTPAGIAVDVVIEPHGEPLPCTFGRGGKGYSAEPIHPGDRVLVAFPDGEPMAGGHILEILASNHDRIPTGDDGKPIAQNDRISIIGRGVPVDIRCEDNGNKVLLNVDGSIEISNPKIKVTVNKDGTVQIGDGAVEQMILGTTYRADQAILDNGIIGAAIPVATAATNASGELAGAFLSSFPNTAALVAALAVNVAAIATLLTAFESGDLTYKSKTTKSI